MLMTISCKSKWKFQLLQSSHTPHEISADFKKGVMGISWEDWDQKMHHMVPKSKEYDQIKSTFSFVSHENTSEWIAETSKLWTFFLALLVFPHLIRIWSFSPYYRLTKITLKKDMGSSKKELFSPYYRGGKFQIIYNYCM